MPTREDVFRVADKMRKETMRISIRSVRRRLPNGGSYRSIGEHLADWKIERCYQPVLETTQLPAALQRQLATLGKTLWDEAMKEAARQPGLLPHVPNGPERGKTWDQLSAPELAGLAAGRDVDLRFSAQTEMRRRRIDSTIEPEPAQKTLL